MAAPQQVLLAMGGSSSDIKLLLHGNGVNGATAAQDSSSATKTTTVLGSAALSNTQTKFGFDTSIYCPGGASAQNGVRVTASGDFNFGANDFTVDCWVYKESTSNYAVVFKCSPFVLYIQNSSDTVRLDWTDAGGSATYIAANSKVPIGEFFHLALARRGRSVEVWINGFVVIKAERPSNYAINFSADWYIGCDSTAGAQSLGGYISEFCVTANYATPTFPQMVYGDNDPDWASVVLAMSGAEFIDRSSYAKTITNSGSSIAQAGLGYDSYYYKGAAASYFKAVLGAEGSLTGDFTIEMNLGGSGSNAAFGTVAGGYLYNNEFSSGAGVSILQYQPSADYERGHVVITRTGSTLRTFYNGRLVSTITNSTTVDVSDIRFGYYVPNNNLYCLGTYDDIRITKGVGRHTATFIRDNVPTAPYTLAPVADPWVVHCNFESDAVGAQSCTNNSVYKLKLDTFGPNAVVSNTRAKFGTKSLLLKAPAIGGLVVERNPILNYGDTEQWTMGKWIYIDVWPAGQTKQLFAFTTANLIGGGWVGMSGASGAIHTTWNFGGGGSPSGTITIPQGQWVYIELSRRADAQIEVYIDGVLDATFNGGGACGSSTEPMRLHFGGWFSYTNGTDNGTRIYMDSPFYCKGRLHTAAFTPPTTPPPY